jgi:phospholipid transport system substrate-binding protein
VAGAAPTAEGAQQFVRSLGDRVMALLQEDISPEERQAELRQVLNEATDLDLVGRLVLGRYWRSATEEQRAEYTDLFRRFVMQNLASRLDTYRGQSYQITGAQVVDDRDALVSTRITRPGSPPLKVDWRLRDTDGDLKIIDVIVEGVSMVVSQRSEFASVIGSAGMDGLLDRLREQVGSSPA